MNERNGIILRLLGSHIFPVIGFIILSVLLEKDSLLLLLISLNILIITFYAGYWEFFGKKFKWVFTISLSAVIVFIFIWRIKGYAPDLNNFQFIVLSILQAYLIFQLIKILITIYERGKYACEIEFPLENGKYLITDGGNSKVSRLMNYHYYSSTHKKNRTNNSMLYATDIVKLSGGNKKFLPLNNEDYPVFNENVYSPMDGIIFKIVNDIPDNRPFSGNYPYNSGNTIVIKNGDYYFLLGHLKYDSIEIHEGDEVQKGQYLAKIGNSGWTERPHLHMQLINSENENYWHGIGVPLKYKNKNLYKNRIIDTASD